MGLFAVPLGTTKREAVEALIGNARLWLEEAALGRNTEHLFSFMKTCLDEACLREDPGFPPELTTQLTKAELYKVCKRPDVCFVTPDSTVICPPCYRLRAKRLLDKDLARRKE